MGVERMIASELLNELQQQIDKLQVKFNDHLDDHFYSKNKDEEIKKQISDNYKELDGRIEDLDSELGYYATEDQLEYYVKEGQFNDEVEDIRDLIKRVVKRINDLELRIKQLEEEKRC